MSTNETVNPEQTTMERYLSFSLGSESYALPLLTVKEVIAPPEITPIPQTPSYFLGIMNLRGLVISVIDLRIKLAIKSSPSSETAIIICDFKTNCIGIMVDSINHVLNFSSSEISSKPEIQSTKGSDYILGVFRSNEKLVLLLDISKTLNAGDHQAIARAENTQPKVKAA